jgi:CRISPR-associated protein Cst2
MSNHLFGIVLTPFGTAANNRGETEGNITTLQKLLWKGEVHTTVSAEAIRAAIRASWQAAGQTLNRTWDEERRLHAWADPEFTEAGEPYLDDDVLGFMSARAARTEAAEEGGEASVRGRGRRTRGTTEMRRGRLEVTRAISLKPWPGDYVFNAASPGATPSASTTGRDPVPYGAEVHATRYQYGFALTPEALHQPARAALVLDSIAGLSEVAGNHARFLYDFSPASLILRWTDDPAPRFLYAYETTDGDLAGVPRLVQIVQAGDISGNELWVGGEVANAADGQALGAQGAHVVESVRETVAAVKHEMGL